MLTNDSHDHYTERGQIALVIVLTSIVIFTIGMSVAARIATDVRIAERAEETVQLQAAIDGQIEHELVDLVNVPPGRTAENHGLSASGLFPGIGVTGTVVSIPPAGVSSFTYEDTIAPGDVKTIWLTDNPDDPTAAGTSYYAGQLTVVWNPRDVEFIIYYDSGAGQPVAIDRMMVSGSSQSFDWSVTPWDTRRAYFVRVRPMNGELSAITLTGYDGDFPAQGYDITVEAIMTNTHATKQIEYRKWYDDYPTYYDFVLYTTDGIRQLQ